MQVCPYCNAQQLDGSIFCSECGAGLLAAAPRNETTTTINQQTHDIDLPTQPAVVAAPVSPSASPAISLVVLNSGRRVNLDMTEELLIGRKDSARGIFPDIDLAHDGGYDAGVSRQHAIIALKDGSCFVEDLDSANGTFVNGKRASSHTPTPLQSGDELKLGTLILRIEMC